MSINAKNISKNFGGFQALKGVDLEVRTGELVALLGPSGSGKTTLLRIIAGLEKPDAGEILFHGEDATRRSARDRHVGFVFQHYALFRHMSVFENVAFGLRVRPRQSRPSNKEIKERVTELLRLVQLEGLAARYPSQLSGGQRQRVALARALAVEPRVLLLDEPFGALDAKVRLELRRWLRRLHDDLHITSVFVTHDQEEALEVADRVVVMNQGRVEQAGTPEEVYEHPANPFVFNFLGNVNLFHGRVHDGEATMGPLAISAPEHAGALDQPAIGYVRPHDLEVVRHKNGGTSIAAAVRHISPVGPVIRLELQRADTGDLIEAELTRERYRELALTTGENVFVKPRKLKVFVDDDYSI
ncbi:MAG: sulfate transporter, ATPase subunit [Armatimonadetes bacterium]|jgi:sulfate transport system ATP-binding protein|nr:sulfate transporter, ATPase subunit [Armatimonadota bacterium]